MRCHRRSNGLGQASSGAVTVATVEILRYTAFSSDPAGGNPAGVMLDATGVDAGTMLAVASDVGYSETAFLVPKSAGEFDVRYFSPQAEVAFCGHATIASAVAYAERHGTGALTLHTPAGEVPVTTASAGGRITATLVSVAPEVTDLPDDQLDELLAALGWTRDDLDPGLPPRIAFAGVRHPVLAAATRKRLAELEYDFDALAAVMARENWTTIALVWREADEVFHARNPFPPGGVVEDPATGAAAAAFGGYLRAEQLVSVPAQITIHQGHDMGRPSLLTVTIPEGTGGIAVAGTAVGIPES